MTKEPIAGPMTPIGEVLKAAGPEGIVLESEDHVRYAVIPLDDDIIDLLIERNPKFRGDCREIRGRMQSGQFQTSDQVRSQLEARKE